MRQKIGQALTEYLILVALVAVASIAVIQTLSFNLRARLSQVANALGGYSSETIHGKKTSEEKYRIRDLGDFHEAIQDHQKR